ncbi:LptA/OstA family protein [Granulicella arctica]|uniref:Lipopolysaccharide export system protein LptA n=1 Tax=Granulicella arctica TaxID=940613 RepID=A0A7Y9PIL1_9BACT|nr:LptA/OstA family protein [Granulicella arctica]NYF79773.1 lipopolysaccharide export system protein LptA [Granulicella arctica]
MRISVERLRVWLVVGVALLVLVIAGFLGYAHYRAHRFLAGLPGKLGVDIRRETNGYTYSQSLGGKTVMTLHASKAVEHNNGKLTLHDVSMILYGRKHDRADRISGSEFEYDQSSGVVRATGEVHIDLEAPPSATASAKKTPSALPFADDLEGESTRVIHVRTSGLVYLQKLGVAATDQDLEFRFAGMIGHATGAEYNSDTGVLILQSNVKTNGIQHGTPVVLTASHAELERDTQLALLTQAKYTSPGQTARADHAVVHLRKEGSPERIEAEGNVVLESPTAGTMVAPHGDILLNPAGQAQSAHFFGGANYEDIDSLREAKSQAQDVRVAFDAVGRPQNVVLTGTVHVNERVRATNAAPWSTRDATAGKMTFALVHDGTGKRSQLREAEATSSAHLALVSDVGTAASSKSDLSGDLLHGHFSGEGKSAQLTDVHGTGHTFLHRVSAQGADQTSSGDTLDVTLRPARKGANPQKRAANQTGTEEIAKATQSGHVVLTSKAAPKPGEKTLPTTSRATADLAVYDGDADDLTLTGQAQVVDDASTLSASKIVMQHESGDATAEGMVKANYVQPNATEPVHILSDHAELKHAAQRAIFYGVPGKPARLWQGASQVEAPILDLEKQQRRLTARAAAAATTPQVHAVLVGNSAAKPGKPARSSVVRIASQTMVYLDQARQVDFNGDVKVEDLDGTLRARLATAYLQPAPPSGPAASKSPVAASKSTPSKGAPTGFFGGSVERIVAKGKIEMEQPGRRASGEQLVYTASDGMFVLSGTPAALPRLIDEVQGTVTGTSLRFHTGDDMVTVIGGGADNPSQRVHTVTKVKQK